MAIKITIEQSGREVYSVRENVIVKETPTNILQKNDYGNRDEVKFQKEYAVQEVEKVNNWTRELLRQTIEDESKFDLAAVIRAINSL